MNNKLRIAMVSMMACLAGATLAIGKETGGETGTGGVADYIVYSMQGSADATSWTMPVKLVNADSYVAYQMSIDLPDGVVVQSVVPNTDRLATGADVTINQETFPTPFVIDYSIEDTTRNIITVTAYNLNNNEIKGTAGDVIMTLYLKSDAPMTSADINVTAISDNLFVMSGGTEGVQLSSQMDDNLLLGDVNHDGVVNPTDAVLVINYYLGKTTEIDTSVADMNSDGVINPTDAVLIINTYLNK